MANEIGRKKGDDQSVKTLNVFDLAEEMEKGSEQVFREKYPHPFLIVRHSPPDDSKEMELRTVETQLENFSPEKERKPIIKVVPLVKTERNAFKSKITLGRAKNNDVILRVSKVSKIHATFVVGKDKWQLLDMGSVNGTVVNDERLEKNQSIEIESGDVISFWRYVFEFHYLDSFIDFLRKFAKREDTLPLPSAE